MAQKFSATGRLVANVAAKTQQVVDKAYKAIKLALRSISPTLSPSTLQAYYEQSWFKDYLDHLVAFHKAFSVASYKIVNVIEKYVPKNNVISDKEKEAIKNEMRQISWSSGFPEQYSQIHYLCSSVALAQTATDMSPDQIGKLCQATLAESNDNFLERQLMKLTS